MFAAPVRGPRRVAQAPERPVDPGLGACVESSAQQRARTAYHAERVRDASPPAATIIAAEALAHVDALYAFAWRLSRSETLAEDLVQDTFARCLAAHERFEPGTNLKAWLFRILRNSFIDLTRREARHALEDAPEREAVVVDPLRGDVEIERLRSLVAKDIEAALQMLSDEQRTVILLDLEGFSEAELAEVMGCAQGTIKSRLARARALLRVQLREYAR